MKIIYNGQSYDTLESWQSPINQPVGLRVDPGLLNPGSGGRISNPERLSSLAAYQLLPSSPLKNQGTDLKDFRVSAGQRDFSGVVIHKEIGSRLVHLKFLECDSQYNEFLHQR